MNTILKLKTSARVSEVNAVAKSILKAYTESSMTEDTTLQLIMNELTSESALLNTAIEQDKALSQMEVYDEARDSAFRGLFYYLQGCTHLISTTTATAAQHLFTLVQKYGVGITQLSYAEQTGQMSSLIEELEQESNQAHITNIPGMADMVENLVKTQADFEKTYDVYLGQLNEDRNKQNASQIKSRVVKVINDRLVVYLRSQLTFNTAVYGDLGGKIAIAIENINSTVSERASKTPKPLG